MEDGHKKNIKIPYFLFKISANKDFVERYREKIP